MLAACVAPYPACSYGLNHDERGTATLIAAHSRAAQLDTIDRPIVSRQKPSVSFLAGKFRKNSGLPWREE